MSNISLSVTQEWTVKKQVMNHGAISNKVISSAASLAAVTVLLGAPVVPATVVASGTSSGAAASYVTLDSFSGHPSGALKVSGGGLNAGESVTVTATQNSVVVATVTTKANASGDYSTSLQLPAKLAQGAVTIAATGQQSGQVSNNSYYVTPFTPTLTPASSQITPYSVLSINGSGYAPNESVELNLAGATVIVQTDATGSFKGANLTTPAVPAASYTLTGTGKSSGASAVAYEYVNAFYPSASPSSYYVMPTAALGFTGSGFAANETVTVTDATSGAVIGSFTTDKTGSFENGGSFAVPASYAGLTKKFVLTGSLSKAMTTTSTVVGRYYPNVSPSNYYVMPGGSVSFNGSGFVPGETVTITSGTGANVQRLGSVVADAKGNLKAAGSVLTTPSQAGSSVTYTLTGEQSQGSGSVSVQVGSYNPQASPSGYYVMPGSTITFNGTGYAPNEVVAVFSGTANLGNFAADNSGAFKNAGAVSVGYAQANSSVSYKLVGAVSNQPIGFSIGVGQLLTQLTPSSFYVLPYAPFSVSVTGFAPSEKVMLSNGMTATTNALGTATFSNVTVPYSPLGSAKLTAVGSTSGASATASIGVGNYYPSVTASNYYAKPGTTIALSGNGFAANEQVTITAGTVNQTAQADAKGDVSASLQLPFGQAKNSLDITSTGALSKASSVTTITLAPYQPLVAPSTYYATPGTAVSFTGSGFVAGERIAVSLNGAQLGTETADAKGNLTSTGTYILPFGKAANFTVTGLTSGGTNTMNIGLAQFYAGVQLNSYYGPAGSSIVASGSGYAPSETITIVSGSTVLATTKADATGAFNAPIVLPYVKAGKLAITASGSLSTAAAETSYTIAQAYTSVGLGSYAVPAGKAVTITGSGFFAGEPVTVTNDRDGSVYKLKADAKGNLNDSGLVLPRGYKEGNLTLTIGGGYSFTSHDITLYVQDVNVQ